MPGFTGQTSVYKSIGRYQGVSALTSKLPGTIRPVQVDIPLICDWMADGSFVCGEDLFGAGGYGLSISGKPNVVTGPCALCHDNCCKQPNLKNYQDCVDNVCPACSHLKKPIAFKNCP